MAAIDLTASFDSEIVVTISNRTNNSTVKDYTVTDPDTNSVKEKGEVQFRKGKWKMLNERGEEIGSAQAKGKDKWQVLSGKCTNSNSTDPEIITNRYEIEKLYHIRNDKGRTIYTVKGCYSKTTTKVYDDDSKELAAEMLSGNQSEIRVAIYLGTDCVLITLLFEILDYISHKKDETLELL